MSCYVYLFYCFLDLSCVVCNDISLYILCCSVNVSVFPAYVPFLHHYIFNVNYMLNKCNQSVIDASLIYIIKNAAVECMKW